MNHISVLEIYLDKVVYRKLLCTELSDVPLHAPALCRFLCETPCISILVSRSNNGIYTELSKILSNAKRAFVADRPLYRDLELFRKWQREIACDPGDWKRRFSHVVSM
ncbi:hypothetical protein NQ318_009028 [Aromia moschata]|uniref:Uncharacterized protein n=1 Tax=Aromia moschata TaxID=1265417 RepID=A0AAV8YT07_9CUCU|nr:hypothetical protein NQ318_009028 [Aromia moschata]